MLRASLVIFFFLSFFCSKSQYKEKKIQQAYEMMFNEDYDKAYEQYTFLVSAYPDNPNLKFYRRVCYFLNDRSNINIKILEDFEEDVDIIGSDYYYWMGRTYFEIYDFEKAFNAFNKHLANSQSGLREESSVFKEWTEEAINFYNAQPAIQVEVKNLSTNSGSSEMSPAVSPDGNLLLYRNTVIQETNNKNQKSGAYIATKSSSAWSVPRSLDNLEDLDADNSRILLGKNNALYFSKNSIIYKASYANKDWASTSKLNIPPFSKNNTSQFYLSPDEDYIIFSMDVGNDNMDLVESKRDPNTGKWSDPKQLAGSINTLYYEDSPFLSADGKTLYYSSNGNGSIGGYDIFKSTLDPNSNTWGEPVNMGYPVNSIDDDFEFSISDDNVTGVFSSNRLDGKGQYDIYGFVITPTFDFRGIVYDENRDEVYTEADITFKNNLSGFDQTLRLANDGTFRLDDLEYGTYNVLISSGEKVLYDKKLELTPSSYKGDLIRFNLKIPRSLIAQNPDRSTSDVNENQPPQEDLSEPTQSLNTSINNELRYTISENYQVGSKLITENVYFEFSNSAFTDEYFQILNKALALLNKDERIRVEVGGHTDNVGSSRNNLKLSQKRANRVKEWLIGKGIGPDRIIARGYGETQPLASNDDEINGRELNRRIEIRLIK